ncbi:MAG: carbon-nitrogen hydrolase family protein [Chloroflexi bacterium]|nr:carbon-nitrogen hydrolase family protein [Chloroflexota bacterium]
MKTITVAATSVRNLIGQPAASIDNMKRWVEVVREKGAELILFPELNVSGYIPAPIAHEIAETIPGPSTEKIIKIADRHNVTICYGLIEKAADKFYCSHVLVNGSGIIGKQTKIHVPAHEKPFWDAGDAISTFDIGKAIIGITICRDSFFDEMTRTLYFKGAEIVLMPFGYYNVPRSRYLKETIHGMSLLKSSWTNGIYAVVCNSAEGREPNEWEPKGRIFPGWAGVISPWGRVIAFLEDEGNNEACVIEELTPDELEDRRSHPNFLAKELRPEVYQFQ